MSAVVTDGEDASPDVVTQQALVRKAVDWQIWPLRGATFILRRRLRSMEAMAVHRLSSGALSSRVPHAGGARRVNEHIMKKGR